MRVTITDTDILAYGTVLDLLIERSVRPRGRLSGLVCGFVTGRAAGPSARPESRP